MLGQTKEEKVCTECGDSKPLGEFPFLNHSFRYGAKCIVCKNLIRVKRNKESRERDPVAHKRKSKKHRLRKYYGITLEQYHKMLKDQDYRCAICDIHNDELTRGLAIDHDHETGEIRGLLCVKCNTILGQANDNIEILINSINYLKLNS